MKEVGYILFATGLVYFASQSAGRTLLRLLRLDLARSEERFIGFVAGSGMLSLLVFLLAAAHLAYRGVFVGLGLLLVATRWIPFGWKPLPPLLPRVSAWWRLAFWACYLVYGFIYVPNALAPEVSPDGTAYHVGLIAQYYRVHHIQWLTTSMYASLSQGIEMLFLFAYGLGVGFARQSAAAMVHLLYLLVLPFGMNSYGRRFGMAGAGVVGGLLFFMSPVVAKSGTAAYNDVAVAAILFAAFYLLQIWAEERSARLFVPIGLLAGFAYGAKYTAFLILPFALVFVAAHLWHQRPAMLRAVLVIGGCAAIMIAPWVIKDAIVVGNPISPFGNTVFRNHYIHPSDEVEYAASMAHFNGVKYREIPMEVCVKGYRLLGIVGPVFLLTPLALLGWRNRHVRYLLLATLVMGVTYFGNLETRFLIPVLPFASLALAATFSYVPGLVLVLLAAHAVLSWPFFMDRYTEQYAWRVSDVPWAAALRLEDPTQFVSKALGDSYQMALQIKKSVPAGQAVYSVGSFLPRSYMDHDVIVGYESAFGRRMFDALVVAHYESSAPTRRHDFKFASHAVRRIRLVQTARDKSTTWSINELRFYRGGTEVARKPEWRLRAWPNPWDVQLAFDNNPVSRWSSWEYYWPGMYVDVDFGSAVEVDEVIADCSPLQENIQLHLEEWSSGSWRALTTEDAASSLPLPAHLRRAAIDYLEANGVHWMVIDKDNWGAKDFLLNRAQWGITPVAITRELVLYRLD
ncbi:MAG TPA: glycosyltransferase family 39 protein [Bryobacteraceae bacterium]|nr:glycosyltransferase family 39 protein [Bryobacteraceae bacterium]